MLAQEDIEQIQGLIQSAFDSRGLETGSVHYDLELRERTVRVEEELKHERDIMIQGFEQVEKRLQQIDRRFEQVDKRFEQIDKRFEAIQDDIKTLYTLINSQTWRTDRGNRGNCRAQPGGEKCKKS